MPKGAGRGGPSKISTFCPNTPRSGGQGSSGEIGLLYDSLMVQNPLCDQNQVIKVNQRNIKIRPICPNAAICLQETMLKRDQIQIFKNYSAYHKNIINGHGGVCFLVKNNFIHSQVHFESDLQAVAVCITINNKAYIVALVYVPPSETLNELAFDRMIKSITSRYLILGDFNGHSYLWGANQENERGKAVEHLIDRHNRIL